MENEKDEHGRKKDPTNIQTRSNVLIKTIKAHNIRSVINQASD